MKRTLEPIPPTLAVDPGAGRSDKAATGLVAVVGLKVVHATNLHRGQAETVEHFCKRVVARVDELRARPCPSPGWTVAVESVVTPSGYIQGRRSSVTPDQVIGFTAIAYAVWARCDGYFVRPAKHGRAHEHTCSGGLLPCKGDHLASRPGAVPACPKEPVGDWYPPEVVGRRPPAWPGEAGTREHEQEAYDIAFSAWKRAALEELVV